MCRVWMALCLVFLLTLQLGATEWAFLKFDKSMRLLRSEIKKMWDRGFSPVGLEILPYGNEYEGAYVLFIKDPRVVVRNWNIRLYNRESEMRSDIAEMAKSGWIPKDISCSRDIYYTLFIKMAAGMKNYTNITLEFDRKGLDALIQGMSERDYYISGISSVGQVVYSHFIEFLFPLASAWQSQTYEFDDVDALEGIQNVADKGWIPWSFLIYRDRITVIYIK